MKLLGNVAIPTYQTLTAPLKGGQNKLPHNIKEVVSLRE